MTKCSKSLRSTWLLLAVSAAAFAAVFTAAGQNLLLNPGFESGTANWFGWGTVSFTTSTAQPHTGTRSAFVTGRSNTYNGVAQSLLGVLQPTNTYRISAWVRLVNATNQPVLLTLHKVDASGTTYQTVASATVPSTNWTQLIGGYTHTVNGLLTNLNLYIEGPVAGVDFYADDFVVETYDWKAQANARIEQVRKRNVRLLIVDAAGNPVPGTTVAVRQTRSRFAFGSAINGNIANSNYAAFFRSNFQWAVMENDSKWPAIEPSRSNTTYTVADSITNFCHTNGITLRGHTLFWAVDNFVQTWVKNLSDADLRTHLSNRIDSAVNHFKGTFLHWDVNNEMLHGNYYGNRLGNGINPWMFQYARFHDPDVKLFVNDYNVISANETEAYKQQIFALIASNAPVNGIGAQGHFGSTINPLLTEARLDSLAELGLPIWITEYDSSNAVASIRADNLEMLYRIAFSKPAVEGVLMWGFWAGSHWRGSNAAIVDLNWTVNAAGQRYQSLLAEWTTVTNGAADLNGAYDFRGFHGSYDITLTPPGGAPTLRRLTLDPGAGTNIVALISHTGGTRPLLHDAGLVSGGAFKFGLTGDAGRTYAVQTSANLSLGLWSTVSNVVNATGTLWFTNVTPVSVEQKFYRAKTLP